MRYGDLIKKYIENDDKYFVLTAENLGPFYYIVDEIPNNYLDVGISEQSMIGISVGLALQGRIPIAHAMASFLMMRAYEFIRTDVGLAELPIKLVGTSAGILSEANGPTHQCIEDISLALTVNKLNIFCPADCDELVNGFDKILPDSQAWYIRYNDKKPIIKHNIFQIGKSEIIGSGNDVALITYGYMFNEVYMLKEKLELIGIKCTVANIRTIRPFDCEILKVMQQCNKTFVIEDHLHYGGLFTFLGQKIVEMNMKIEMHSISFKSFFSPGEIQDVLDNENMSVEKMFQFVKDISKDVL